MKILVYGLILIAFLLVTFFGLGPVLLADGTMAERLATLAVVLLIYALLALITVAFARRGKKSKG